jgi:hypothetical protein
MLFEEAKQPASRDPGMASRVFAGDQEREVERVGQRQVRQIMRRRDGGADVPPLNGSLEDRIGMALRGDGRCSLLGPGRPGERNRWAGQGSNSPANRELRARDAVGSRPCSGQAGLSRALAPTLQ